MSPRPRRSQATVLAATLDVIAEHGVSGATVDTVAARIGASKATIYRHWGSRARLIYAAISSLEGPSTEPDTGSLRGDLVALIEHLVAYFNRREVARIFPSFIDAAVRDPELARLRQQTLRRGRTSFERVVRRGIERGELPGDIDIALFVDLVRSTVIYRRVIAQTTVRKADIAPIVDLALAAAHALSTLEENDLSRAGGMS